MCVCVCVCVCIKQYILVITHQCVTLLPERDGINWHTFFSSIFFHTIFFNKPTGKKKAQPARRGEEEGENHCNSRNPTQTKKKNQHFLFLSRSFFSLSSLSLSLFFFLNLTSKYIRIWHSVCFSSPGETFCKTRVFLFLLFFILNFTTFFFFWLFELYTPTICIKNKNKKPHLQCSYFY